MDMSIGNVAARETAINKANVGQDILMKTLEKSAEAQQQNKSETARPVQQVQPDKQGRIDLYA